MFFLLAKSKSGMYMYMYAELEKSASCSRQVKWKKALKNQNFLNQDYWYFVAT